MMSIDFFLYGFLFVSSLPPRTSTASYVIVTSKKFHGRLIGPNFSNRRTYRETTHVIPMSDFTISYIIKFKFSILDYYRITFKLIFEKLYGLDRYLVKSLSVDETTV